MRFEDRTEAGERLAAVLSQFRAQPGTLVLGLARGGIPVAAAAAKSLYLPLGTVLVRKLGIPGHEETAYGALAWAQGRTVRLLNKPLLDRVLEHGVRQEWLDEVEQRERAELLRRVDLYPEADHDVSGKTVILVDDGLATGATMRAAVAAVRRQDPASVTVAVPVGSPRVRAELRPEVDRVVCLETPAGFRAVGQAYRDFAATDDAEVVAALDDARSASG